MHVCVLAIFFCEHLSLFVCERLHACSCAYVIQDREMKGSCNYREAYLSTAEVSEEWHKLGQKPEVIRSAACVCACVSKLGYVCVFVRERDKGKEKERESKKENGRRREIGL